MFSFETTAQNYILFCNEVEGNESLIDQKKNSWLIPPSFQKP